MAFFCVPYSPARCQTCRRPAAVEVKTSGTMSHGYFCKACGRRRVDAGNEHLKMVRAFSERKAKQ